MKVLIVILKLVERSKMTVIPRKEHACYRKKILLKHAKKNHKVSNCVTEHFKRLTVS